ncbi:MAG: transporter, partial [Nitrospirae bacterium]|nr:transporter [Nitrospirota bacterium]
MRKAGLLPFLFVILLFTGECLGTDPYDNIAVPPGPYLSTYPYYFSSSELADKNGNRISKDPDAKTYQNTLKFNYYDKTVLPNTSVLAILVPGGCTQMLGDHDCGIGDLLLVAGYWLVDDPDSKTWFGIRPSLSVPTGSYDKNRKANMGSNVWQVRPIVFFAKQFWKIDLELTAKYNIFTKNDDTHTRQGNQVIFEEYAGYFIRPDLLLGFHFNGIWGQDTIVNGAPIHESGVQKYQAGPSIFKDFGNGFAILIEGL